MPDQWERHGKDKYDWGQERSRSQQRTAAANDDPVKNKVPGKKNKDACKANHWGPHVPSYTFEKYLWYNDRKSCGWSTTYQSGQYVPYWYCGETGRCVLCGKHLGDPPVCHSRTRDNLEPPPWVIEEAQDKTEAYQARRAKWSPRRVIKGPSHYRKPKGR